MDGDQKTGYPKRCLDKVLKAERERQRDLGTDQYRKEAIERMRKLKTSKTLPYDKTKRYGD